MTSTRRGPARRLPGGGVAREPGGGVARESGSDIVRESGGGVVRGLSYVFDLSISGLPRASEWTNRIRKLWRHVALGASGARLTTTARSLGEVRIVMGKGRCRLPWEVPAGSEAHVVLGAGVAVPAWIRAMRCRRGAIGWLLMRTAGYRCGRRTAASCGATRPRFQDAASVVLRGWREPFAGELSGFRGTTMTRQARRRACLPPDSASGGRRARRGARVGELSVAALGRQAIGAPKRKRVHEGALGAVS